MKRRNFFGKLGASLGLLVFGGNNTQVKAMQPPEPLSLCKCPVAGFQYYQGPFINAADLKPGQPLKLQREPDNPYDSQAISIHTQSSSKLGYVPRTHNPVPAGLMDKGRILTAKLISMSPGIQQGDVLMVELLMIPGDHQVL